MLLFHNNKKHSKRLFPMSQMDLTEMLRMDCYKMVVDESGMASEEFILNEGRLPMDVFKLWSHKPRLRDPEERGKPSLSEGFRTKVNYRTNWQKSGDIYVGFFFIINLDLYIYRYFIFPLLENKNKKNCAEVLHIKIGKCYFCTMACRFGFIFVWRDEIELQWVCSIICQWQR